MAVGSQFAKYINPLLAVLKDLGGSARSSEAKAAVAKHLRLPGAVVEDQLESGSSRFDNQVSWARYYLVRAGYIDSSRRGVWALTEKGRNTDALSDEEITKLVRDMIATWGRRSKGTAEATPDPGLPSDEAPDDHRFRLLALLKDLPPTGFERLCQRLLREAGVQQVSVTARSGDRGIDGIEVLELNAFVSFKVLFQCKRYKETVGPSVVRDFRGAMMGRADKGLILTTGSFTAEARREAASRRYASGGATMKGQFSEFNQVFVEQGEVSKVNLDRVQLELEQAASERLLYDMKLGSSRTRLAQLMGMSPDYPFEVQPRGKYN